MMYRPRISRSVVDSATRVSGIEPQRSSFDSSDRAHFSASAF
jgi:hypothetical protein